MHCLVGDKRARTLSRVDREFIVKSINLFESNNDISENVDQCISKYWHQSVVRATTILSPLFSERYLQEQDPFKSDFMTRVIQNVIPANMCMCIRVCAFLFNGA